MFVIIIIITLIFTMVNKFLPQISLSYNFRLGRSTVCSIVRETCGVIWDVLAKDYVKAPSSVKEWKQISREFFLKWNFPNCIGIVIVNSSKSIIMYTFNLMNKMLYIYLQTGALDGKHIAVQAPKKTGSLYFFYLFFFLFLFFYCSYYNYNTCITSFFSINHKYTMNNKYTINNKYNTINIILF